MKRIRILSFWTKLRYSEYKWNFFVNLKQCNFVSKIVSAYNVQVRKCIVSVRVDDRSKTDLYSKGNETFKVPNGFYLFSTSVPFMYSIFQRREDQKHCVLVRKQAILRRFQFVFDDIGRGRKRAGQFVSERFANVPYVFLVYSPYVDTVTAMSFKNLICLLSGFSIDSGVSVSTRNCEQTWLKLDLHCIKMGSIKDKGLRGSVMTAVTIRLWPAHTHILYWRQLLQHWKPDIALLLH